MNKLVGSGIIGIIFLGLFLVTIGANHPGRSISQPVSQDESAWPAAEPSPTQPPAKILNNDYHIFQTFNNCGPAALSMALSYYGVTASQEELGRSLRPNQNPKGIADDKSVTLEELAIKASEYGLIPYHRPNGSVSMVKRFIAHDIPVIARTNLTADQDIGHYRIIKGYNDETGQFLQDDSLQGKNIWYAYEELDALWEVFNYEYLVLVPQQKNQFVQAILEDDYERARSWERAVLVNKSRLDQNPDSVNASFNLSVAYYNAGKPHEAIEAFERVQSKLSRRTLWYQLEPVLSYMAIGNYAKVHELSGRILSSENTAFAELYLLQAEAFRLENKNLQAKHAFQQALTFNTNLLQYQTILSEDSVSALRML